jgi:sodium/hydrogen antiporter
VDIYILDLLVIGLVLLFVTFGSSWIARLPLTYSLIYLLVGILLGPYALHLIQVRPQAAFLERLTEFVVIVSLFSCGQKINRPLQIWSWDSTVRLIGFLMPISIFSLAIVTHWFLNFDWGAAILLGAILAPTDPVLASEVQISDINDRDELRFGLTSEAGLNDALSFPFVYFGLYWLKDSDWQNWFKQWVVVDLLWAIAFGIIMGILVAKAVSWIELKLHQYRPLDTVMEDFTPLGTILLTYSLTELVNGYGFLAVFIAGIVVNQSELEQEKRLSQIKFTERIEKLIEIGTILLLGSLLRLEPIRQYAGEILLISILLLFVIRPVGAWLSTIGERYHPAKRLLFGWFGIRGVGSLYYLSYAFGEGLSGEIGERIAWITYLTIVLSVILHGTSATPLMNWYEKYLQSRENNRLV